MSEKLKIPFTFVFDVTNGTTGRFRCPTGYVFEDLYFANMANSDLRISLSRNVDQASYVEFPVSDLAQGALPTSLDFTANFLWWSSNEPIRFHGIGQAEFRSMQVENNGFGTFSLVIWGTYTKDPRCYV